MSASHSSAPSDRSAAYTGLVVGAICVFLILLGVVKWTNSSFAAEHGEHGKKEAAEAGK